MERISLKPPTLLKDIDNYKLVMFINRESKLVYLTAQVEKGVVFFQVNGKDIWGLNRYFGVKSSMEELSNTLIKHEDFKNLEYYLLEDVHEFYKFVFDNPEWFKDK